MVDFDFSGVIQLGGKVYLGDETIPLANLTFEAISATIEEPGADMTRTDDEGNYEVFLEHAGPHWVRFFLTDRGKPFVGQLELDVPEDGSEDTDLRFVAGVLSGRVVDQDGQPIAEALVELSHLSEESGEAGTELQESYELVQPYQPRTVAEDGAFEFAYLASDRYALRVSAEGFAQKIVDAIQLETDEVLSLPDIVLVRTMALEVQALDPERLPLNDALVGAMHNGQIGRPTGTPPNGKTGPDGKVAITGLQEGTLSLVGFYPGLAPAIMHGVDCCKDADSNPVELPFHRGGTLEIQFLDEDSVPVEGCRLQVLDESNRDLAWIYEYLLVLSNRSTFSDKRGYILLDAVIPGTYVISANGLEGQATATVNEGQETQIIVRVERGASP